MIPQKLIGVGCDAGIAGSFSFCRAGTSSSLVPDRLEGGAFEGPVNGTPLQELADSSKAYGMNGLTVTDIGFDLVLDLDVPMYVDTVVVSVRAGDELSNISLLIESETDVAPVCVDRQSAPATGDRNEGDCDEYELVAGEYAKKIFIRVETCYRNVTIEGVGVWGLPDGLLDLYPTPNSIDIAPADSVHRTVPVCIDSVDVGAGTDDDICFVAEFLKSLVEKKFGNDVNQRAHTCEDAAKGVGEDARRGSGEDARRGASIVLHLEKPDVSESREVCERFSIDIADDRIVLQSPGRLGLLYAASAFVQLVTRRHDRLEAPVLRIDDSPAHTHRGIHIGLPPREEIDFFKRLVRYLLVPYRYNTIFIEFAAGMEYKRHPEINEAWIEANHLADQGGAPPVPHAEMVAGKGVLTQEEVTSLVAYIRAHGLEIIPEVQSLSHVQYLNLSHPELAEIPVEEASSASLDVAKDDKRPVGYHHCCCPLAPGLYEIMFDLIDEIVDVVRPESFVHLGHDEIYQIATCERCKDVSKAKLFADDVNKLDNHVKSKGLRSMIWSDMLQPLREYDTEGAIDSLPKDMVMLDFVWYFYLDEDIEDNLLDRGFQVIMGNMYSSHYPRYARRIRKPGMIGGEVSTWCRADEKTLSSQGKIYDLLYSSEMLWYGGYDERLRRSIDSMIVKRIPELRSFLGGTDRPSALSSDRLAVTPVDLSRVPSIGTELASCEPDLAMFMTSPKDRLLGQSVRKADGVIVVAPSAANGRFDDSVEIPVGSCAEALYFVHCTTGRCALGEIVGRYVVCFSDGIEVEIPVEYGYNISVYTGRHNEPLKHPAYRHFGYTATYAADEAVRRRNGEGKVRTLYGYEWLNQRSESSIDSIRVEALGDGTAGLLVVFNLLLVKTAK